MKYLFSLIAAVASFTAFPQLTEKDQQKLDKYEILLKEGDIYSSKIKVDKLLEKYPNETAVLDFSIRLEIAKFIDSFRDSPNTFVQTTNKPVRGIRYRKVVTRLEFVLNENLNLMDFCAYYDFLITYQDEAPYDMPPTSFKEIYESELNRFQNHCIAN